MYIYILVNVSIVRSFILMIDISLEVIRELQGTLNFRKLLTKGRNYIEATSTNFSKALLENLANKSKG